MKLILNGNEHELTGDEPTVADLVTQLGFDDSPVAVEVNKQVIPKRQHTDHPLNEGDMVEVVTLVGGG